MPRKPEKKSRFRNASHLCARCHTARRADGYSYCRPCDRAMKTASRSRCKSGKPEDAPIPRDMPAPPRRTHHSTDDRVRHECDTCGVLLFDERTRCSMCQAIGEMRLGI